MYTLPNKLNSFTAYEPIVGDYPIRLDVNESFFEIPTDKVVRAVMEINQVKLNRYPDPYASEVVSAFSKLFNVNPRCVTAGNGSDELIGLIVSGLLEKMSRVLTLTPDFSMYGFYSKLYELQVVEMQKESDFTVDVGELIDFVTENKIKCLIFSNPCNPTSLGLEKSEVERLVTELAKIGVLVVVDEAYMDFWCESQSMLNQVNNYDNLIVLRTCSKSVALAGIRLGFAVCNEKISEALRLVKSPFNVNSLSQAIGTAILSDVDGYSQSIAFIKENTKALHGAMCGLKALGVFEKIYDTRTNFIFAETDDAEEIYEFLLTKGIAVRCFPGHLRICAGTRDEMNELVKAISQWKLTTIDN